jgi:hypothetical protein
MMKAKTISTEHKGVFAGVMIAAAFIMLCLLFLPVINYNSIAEDNPVIVVDNKTMHVGQTFEMRVELTENTGLEAIVLQVDYDETVFTLMNVERGNALRNLTYTTTNINTNLGYAIRPFKMLWDGRAPDSSTGTMVIFTFRASREAEKKDYDIAVSYEEKNTKSSYGIRVPIDISGGTVTLIGGIYTINYLDYDGTILQSTEYNEEATPQFIGNEPSRAETDAYSYYFNGWVPEANENSSLLIYRADYISIPKIYTVNYYLEGELFLTEDYAYNTDITRVSVPDREYYEFSGWCTDYTCENRLRTGSTMPANDLDLYGRYVFNMRADEAGIPVVEMVANDNGDGQIRVDVNLLANTGLSGMILTLDFDYAEMRLTGVERGEALPLLQFETTNTENGYDEIPFKLYWEGVQNDYSIGTIARLYFQTEQGIPDGQYYIGMTYASGQDISYLENGSPIYSDVVIETAVIVVTDGILDWNVETEPECYKGWIVIIIILIIIIIINIIIIIYLLYRNRVLDERIPI